MSNKGTIVVASNDVGFVEVVRNIGRDIGATVAATDSMSCAIDLFHQGRIRVTIIDQALTDGSGFDLLQRIRHIDPDAKVVFVAEAPAEEFERQVRSGGVSYFGNKPVSPALFRRVVEKVLEHETRRIKVQGTA